MLSDTLKELLRPLELVPRVIWAALTLSMLIYVCVVYYMAQAGQLSSVVNAEVAKGLLTVCPLVAAVLACVSFLVRRLPLSERLVKARLASPIELSCHFTNPQTGLVNEQKRAKIESLSQREKKLLQVSTMCFPPTLLSMVVNEAIVILGLLLAILTGAPTAIVPYALIGITLNAVMFPSIRTFVEKVQSSHCFQ
jgi:hypothetical protein